MRVSTTATAGVLLVAGLTLAVFSLQFAFDPRLLLRHMTLMIVGALFIIAALLLLGMEKMKDEVLEELAARRTETSSSGSAVRSVAHLEAR